MPFIQRHAVQRFEDYAASVISGHKSPVENVVDVTAPRPACAARSCSTSDAQRATTIYQPIEALVERANIPATGRNWRRSSPATKTTATYWTKGHTIVTAVPAQGAFHVRDAGLRGF